MRTSLGLPENVEGALAYVLGCVSGIILLLLEKNHFVRFHAMQSTLTFLSLWILSGILRFVPFLGWILTGVVSIFALALWIVGIYKAFVGEYYKFPLFGDFAEILV